MNKKLPKELIINPETNTDYKFIVNDTKIFLTDSKTAEKEPFDYKDSVECTDDFYVTLEVLLLNIMEKFNSGFINFPLPIGNPNNPEMVIFVTAELMKPDELNNKSKNFS